MRLTKEQNEKYVAITEYYLDLGYCYGTAQKLALAVVLKLAQAN